MTAIKQSQTSHPQSDDGLTWYEKLGYGINLTPCIDYDGDYWAEYQSRDSTPMGQKLTQARYDLVKRHTNRTPVDIGIGAGAFVSKAQCFGYDINPIAVAHLKKLGRYVDVYQSYSGCLTFWDSLEHIPDPKLLLVRVPTDGKVFVSLPIFNNQTHCLSSRHYKPGEHIWYFTHDGFLSWMLEQGFCLDEYTNVESVLGRDGIVSYAFTKRGNIEMVKGKGI